MRQAVSRFIIRAGARVPWIAGRSRRVVGPLGVAGLAVVVGVGLAVHSAALPAGAFAAPAFAPLPLVGFSSRHVSAHYVVARDGQITQMVSENQVAFHAGIVTAGPGSRFLGTSPNAYSIGIEIENPSVIHGAAEFPAAQKAAVFKLVKDVVQRNHIPIDREHIVGHSEIDPANRQDPGPGFPWEELLAYVQS